MNKVDVCLVTKEDTISEGWKETLKYIPLNKLIVEHSTPLGLARMRAIQKVETEWFIFLDDDVYITKKWFSEISKHIDDKVGAVQGFPIYKGAGKWDTVLNALRPSNPSSLSLGERGKTHNVLIKTDLVKDWRPSRPDLSSWEDYEITQHILKKGVKWMVCPVDTFHLRSFKKILKNVGWNVHGWRKTINPEPKTVVNKLLYHMKSSFVHLIKIVIPDYERTRHFYQICVNLAYMWGLLS